MLDGTDTSQDGFEVVVEQGSDDLPIPESQGTAEGDNQGTSETPTPKTFTEEQVKKQVDDALAKAGRDVKILEDKQKALKQSEDELKQREFKLAEWQRTRDEEELESVQDDPDKLNVIQERQRIREDKRKIAEERKAIEAEKAQHAEDIRIAQETKREATIQNIASKYGIDAQVLKDLDLSPEQTEKVAAKFSKARTSKTKDDYKPDSGETRGGTSRLTPEKAESLSMEDYARHPDVKARYGMK